MRKCNLILLFITRIYKKNYFIFQLHKYISFYIYSFLCITIYPISLLFAKIKHVSRQSWTCAKSLPNAKPPEASRFTELKA